VINDLSNKSLKTKYTEYRLLDSSGTVAQKGRSARTLSTEPPRKMATERTRAAGIESGDAPTAATTHYDARDRLAGRLGDETVRQAAADGGFGGATPTPNGLQTTERRLL